MKTKLQAWTRTTISFKVLGYQMLGIQIIVTFFQKERIQCPLWLKVQPILKFWCFHTKFLSPGLWVCEISSDIIL